MAKITYTKFTGNAGYLLGQFADFVGPNDLSTQLKRVRKKFHGRVIASRDTQARFAIPTGLTNLYGRRISAPRFANIMDVPYGYEALSFAAVAVELSRHLTTKGRNLLRGRVLAALKPGSDARPLAHEFRVITTLAQWDWDVEFTDFEGRGRYDFTARKGEKELEVECKTITGDCGNPIHREDFENFGNDVLRRLSGLKLRNVWVRIDIAFPDRLPKQAEAKEEIGTSISQMLDSHGTRALVRDASLTLRWLEKSPLDPSDPPGSAEIALTQIRDEKNGAVVGIFSQTEFIAVHVFSNRKSKVQKSIYDTIEQASDQLSKDRAGIIWTHFVDITDSELESLIKIYQEGTSTALQGIGYKMFNDARHDHVAALFFSGEAPIKQHGGPSSLIIHQPYYSQSGILYPLWNKGCRHNEPFRELM